VTEEAKGPSVPSDSTDAADVTTPVEPPPGRRNTREWGWVRPFFVRVLINALTLFGLLALFQVLRLPSQDADGLYVLDERILTFGNAGLLELLLLGLSLALVGVLVRPVLTALSGSLVVRTYGLMVVVINIIVFWLAIELATLFSRVTVEVPAPRIIWILLIGTLFSFTLLAVNTLLGLNRPRLRDAGEDQPIWRLLDRLPLSRRNRARSSSSTASTSASRAPGWTACARSVTSCSVASPTSSTASRRRPRCASCCSSWDRPT